MRLLTLCALLPSVLALPSQTLDFARYGIAPRADSSLTNYLGVFFLGDKPSVYFYLSNGNNANSMIAMNKGQPVIIPTKGTQGVRDPAIISGGAAEAGKKWYIIGTDLDIGKTTWDASQRTGSRGIFVWESTDLVTWTNERLVTVEDSTAGMVWAPSAIWDEAKGQYFVHWASKFYPTSDPQHTGAPSSIRIRYAYTKDFKTFTAPQDYINRSPTNIIDQEFLALGNNAYARFLKDESAKTVFTEISTNGLFGTWSRPAGANAIIASGVEGPAPYWDNQVAGKAHLLLDFYGADGYRPYESSDVKGGKWTASDRSAWPQNLRHGSVLGVNATQVEALKKKWSVIAPGPDLHQDLTVVDSSSTYLTATVDPEDHDPIWQKAYCRGAALVKAMSLDEQESTRSLGWPYTQSPWDGDLKPELRKWGYLDDDNHHAMNDNSCDFSKHHIKRAFDALGIDPRSARKGGPNHCFMLEHRFGPTVILDKNGEMPNISKQRYEADGKMYRVTGAYSKFGINRKDGIVYFLDRHSPEKSAQQVWGQEQIDKADLPALRSSSDLAWGLWNRIEGEPSIKMIMALNIINDETVDVIIPRALKAMGKTEVETWPGTDLIVGANGGAEAEAALALIGSPNGLGAGYFLLQHKRQLGGDNFIWKIKIFKGDDDDGYYDDPALIFYIDKHTPPMPDSDDTPGSPIEEAKAVRRSKDRKNFMRTHKIWAKL
ncbi:unnamed protein product [Alternaria sp. RS040]